jgi:hypothetical protein
MRKKMMLCLLLLPLSMYAQRQTEYNRRGDEAMEKKDYRDARMWYEEGVAYCDIYSIDQLTRIWQADETMHLSMRTAMANCLNCLNKLALENDTVAMNKLIVFYTEGIGTVRSESSANYWKNQLETIRPSYTTAIIPYVRAPRERMHFFVGYHASPIAPYGIQIGGFNSRLGWYLRLHSDFSFRSPDGTLRMESGNAIFEGIDTDIRHLKETGKDKPGGTLMGSAGIMMKTVSDLYLSVGVGYWMRDMLPEYQAVDDDGKELSATFLMNPKHSHSGVKIDLDAVYLFGKRFYGTAGCSVLSFRYVYPNVGVGVYF